MCEILQKAKIDTRCKKYIIYEKEEMNIKMINKNCNTCIWHDNFTGVCFNGDSEWRADFTDDNYYCKYWKYKENEQIVNEE